MRGLLLNAKQVTNNNSPLIIDAINIGGHYFDSRSIKVVVQSIAAASVLTAAIGYSFMILLF